MINNGYIELLIYKFQQLEKNKDFTQFLLNKSSFEKLAMVVEDKLLMKRMMDLLGVKNFQTPECYVYLSKFGMKFKGSFKSNKQISMALSNAIQSNQLNLTKHYMLKLKGNELIRSEDMEALCKKLDQPWLDLFAKCFQPPKNQYIVELLIKYGTVQHLRIAFQDVPLSKYKSIVMEKMKYNSGESVEYMWQECSFGLDHPYLKKEMENAGLCRDPNVYSFLIGERLSKNNQIFLDGLFNKELENSLFSLNADISECILLKMEYSDHRTLQHPLHYCFKRNKTDLDMDDQKILERGLTVYNQVSYLVPVNTWIKKVRVPKILNHFYNLKQDCFSYYISTINDSIKSSPIPLDLAIFLNAVGLKRHAFTYSLFNLTVEELKYIGRLNKSRLYTAEKPLEVVHHLLMNGRVEDLEALYQLKFNLKFDENIYLIPSDNMKWYIQHYEKPILQGSAQHLECSLKSLDCKSMKKLLKVYPITILDLKEILSWDNINLESIHILFSKYPHLIDSTLKLLKKRDQFTLIYFLKYYKKSLKHKNKSKNNNSNSISKPNFILVN